MTACRIGCVSGMDTCTCDLLISGSGIAYKTCEGQSCPLATLIKSMPNELAHDLPATRPDSLGLRTVLVHLVCELAVWLETLVQLLDSRARKFVDHTGSSDAVCANCAAAAKTVLAGPARSNCDLRIHVHLEHARPCTFTARSARCAGSAA